MSRVISESSDLSRTLIILQQIMGKEMDIICGMITLYHQKIGKILLPESFGLTEEEASRGFYTLGEGITGKVVETGKAIMLPSFGDEPAFTEPAHSGLTSIRNFPLFACQ
jgi:Nif-specific regulatory protein